MRPFDLRLVQTIKPVRGAIGFTAVLAFVGATFLVVQSIATARAISLAFLEHQSLSALTGLIALGCGAWIARSIVTAVSDWWVRRAGVRSVADARALAMARLADAPLSRQPLASGSMVALLTRGIEGLDAYVARYLPQLVISAIVPLSLGAVIFWLDPLAAVIIAVTIPLIPLFMALVGWFTQSNVERHWQRVMSLSATIVDLMNGLPELKVFGRAIGQAAEIERLGCEQQAATMRVLKLSFLSAFVLELLATISVAIVAVAIGLRLVNGEMELWRGLAALMLAPEVYAPFRMLGVHFHAAAEGLEAWRQLESVLDATSRPRGSTEFPSGQVTLEWTQLTVQLGERQISIPAGSARPGEITALVGPSGCGKSTLLGVGIGNFVPTEGSLTYHGEDTPGVAATAFESASFARAVAYVAQSPWLGEGSVYDVVTRGVSDVSRERVAEVLQQLELPLSLDAFISDRSQGVSVGQRRRLAVARALVSDARVVILDEPSAALDEVSEAAVGAALKSLADRSVTVLLVAHRKNMIALADSVIDFSKVIA